MRCVKEPDSACSRCQKNGRECIASTPARSAASHRKKQDRPAARNEARQLEERSYQHSVVSIVPSSSSGPLLPTVYSTSPYSSHLEHEQDSSDTHQHRRHKGPETLPRHPRAESIGNDAVSREEMMQLVEMYFSRAVIQVFIADKKLYRFRQRLLICLPVLISDDYADFQSLISRYPGLVYCICYVTARFVPGYEEVRQNLVPAVSNFLHAVFTRRKYDEDEELATMQALIILHVYARGDTMETSSESPINYWSLKATCEAFAMHINLHRSADDMRKRSGEANVLRRSDTCTKKYLYWLWLYASSQQYASQQ